MKATFLEFRLRFVILCVIFALGFWTPCNRWLHLDSGGANAHVWGTLAVYLAMLKPDNLSIVLAFRLLLSLGILFALLGACLRTWGSAYLGSSVVQDPALHGERMVAAGPYRYLRNPLYLGLFFFTLALALLMPPSGAIFTIVLVSLFQMRLIGAEEAFLTTQLGMPYLEYKASVPSLLPSLRPRIPASSIRPAWPLAFLSEIAMWGVVFSFAALGWQYNALLILRGVLVSVGLSIIVRGLLPRKKGL